MEVEGTATDVEVPVTVCSQAQYNSDGTPVQKVNGQDFVAECEFNIIKPQMSRLIPISQDVYSSINNEEDILYDLYICFLNVARRYKQIGKNFCAYLYNVYKHEVARFIKAYIKNPLSIPYKNFQYEDFINGSEDVLIIEEQESSYYESLTGLPDMSWILGDTCSCDFLFLSPLQRKIIIKYYLEDWSDRQIAESMGIQTSSINSKRREALSLLCQHFNVDQSTLKRMRKSGTNKDKTK